MSSRSSTGNHRRTTSRGGNVQQQQMTDTSSSSTRFATGIFICMMLVTGTMNTLAKAFQNHTEVYYPSDGTTKDFKFPWTQSLFMFVGEASCFLYVFFQACRGAARDDHGIASARGSFIGGIQNGTPKLDEPLLRASDIETLMGEEEHDMTVPPVSSAAERYKYLIFVIPTLCDLCGTSFGGVGLLYISPSIWQMLRGSIIIFSSVLSVVFLKRKIQTYQWFGVFVVTVGLACVGVSSLLKQGLFFTVTAQFFSASQMVVEEKFVKGLNLEPSKVVAFEGMYGALIMAAIVLPCFYFAGGENALEGLEIIRDNHTELLWAIVYTISIAFYNVCSLNVAKNLSTVHRTLIDALRTVAVWGVEVFIFYVLHDEAKGEEWSPYSFVQLGGFALLIVGTLVYNRVIVLPARCCGVQCSAAVANSY